jgi:hypothetical protein
LQISLSPEQAFDTVLTEEEEEGSVPLGEIFTAEQVESYSTDLTPVTTAVPPASAPWPMSVRLHLPALLIYTCVEARV